MSLDDIPDLAERLTLDAAEIRRYARHLILPEVGIEGQKRLKAARVLLVGAGGLGSPVGLYLAAAGIGTLGVVDGDRVEESNLQRQVLYGHSDVGRPKVDAALERLRAVNSAITLRPHALRLAAANAEELIAGYDVVVDGSDNFPTRYLVNDACVLAGKPDVWGAIQRFEGRLSVFWAERGPCYRCLFPEPPPPGVVPSCAEAGVLGVVPGIIGALQANEVVKLILGLGEPLVGRLAVFDALRLRVRELTLGKRRDCPRCGERPTLGELVDYQEICETAAVPSLPGELPFEIRVEELRSWLDDGRSLTLLDVREAYEAVICELEGSRRIPLGQLPQRIAELDPAALIVVYCHHGVRSAQALRYLRQQGFRQVTHLGGGIDAWSVRIDPAVPRY
ncbi:MAG: molybdopterin-synthase adenylyltransferase MoeB [bacterium]|nr:molybdopterin-synthase adenylyltransferase MoeB [bacterium]